VDVLEAPATELLSSGDAGATLAALMVLSGHSQDKLARASRDAAEKAEDAAFSRKIDDMKSAADARFAAGIADGIGKLGGAACAAEGARFDADSGAARTWGATGKESEAVGGLVSAGFKWQADRTEAKVAQDDREVTAAKRNWESSDGNVKDARKVMTDAIEFLKEYSSTKSQMQQASIHRA
jgi:hypothetical protein